jgi:putative membrane protein
MTAVALTVLTVALDSPEKSAMPTPSPEIQAFATGFPLFLGHVLVTVLILVAAAGAYILLTPHKEISLIREGNTAAAVSLAGVLVGLAIPLAVSLRASANLIDIGLWGVATVVVQLLVFRLVDLVLHGLPRRIQEGELAAATLLVGAKLSTAVIVAAAVAG